MTSAAASPFEKIIFLDSYPLSILANATMTPTGAAINRWAISLLAAGHRLYVPEIIDYELRRELLRAGKAASIRELDVLKSRFRYAPLSTMTMLRAADLWAQMRNKGTPTGDPKRLDIDVILAAQAITEGEERGIPATNVIVATSNVLHLSRMPAADVWQNITA